MRREDDIQPGWHNAAAQVPGPNPGVRRLTLPVREYHGLPEGFLDSDPRDLHQLLPEPALIHVPGQRQPPLAVVFLLHGNEPVGLQALQRVLRRHAGQDLPRSLVLVAGNVQAAALNHRHLDDQPDYNRVWPGTEQPGSLEAEYFAAVVQRLRSLGVFAAVDLHNNTGRNPHYACINVLKPQFLHLAGLFGQTIVYFTRPRGVASMALAALAPAVTLECGHPGEEAGIEHAADYLDRLLSLDDWPTSPPPTDLDIYQTVARVRVRPGLRVGLEGEQDVDIWLEPDLDRKNFQSLPAGTPLLRLATPGLEPLVATDPDGREVTDAFLCEGKDGRVRLCQAVMPAMLTLNTRVIAQDCLGYFMKPLRL